MASANGKAELAEVVGSWGRARRAFPRQRQECQPPSHCPGCHNRSHTNKGHGRLPSLRTTAPPQQSSSPDTAPWRGPEELAGKGKGCHHSALGSWAVTQMLQGHLRGPGGTCSRWDPPPPSRGEGLSRDTPRRGGESAMASADTCEAGAGDWGSRVSWCPMPALHTPPTGGQEPRGPARRVRRVAPQLPGTAVPCLAHPRPSWRDWDIPTWIICKYFLIGLLISFFNRKSLFTIV